MPRQSTTTRPCAQCGQPFAPERQAQRYCSLSCVRLSRRTCRELPCPQCGRVFRQRMTNQRFCSPACKHAASRTDAPARFWAKVNRSGGPDACWPWTAGTFAGKEYGVFRVDGKNLRAHRYAYELIHGPLAEGVVVRHDCDNPRCCNPAHLDTGTPQDNSNDMVSRGRSRKGEQVNKARLASRDIPVIRTLYRQGWSQQAIADKFGVNQGTISMVILRKTWRHVA